MTPTPTRPEPTTPTREERIIERLCGAFGGLLKSWQLTASDMTENEVLALCRPSERDAYMLALWAKQRLTSEPAASVVTPTAPLTTAADWAGAFSELPALPEDAADAFLAKTYAICDSGSWRTAMIGFLTTYAAQVRPQWMPIASAPKDGTRVLIASLGGIGIGRWGKSAADHEPGWADGGAYFIKATHWQPLPSPPGSPSSQTDTGDSNV